MWKYFAPLVIFGLLVLLLMSGLGKDPSRLPSPLIEKPAPQFDLPSLTRPGETLGTADFDGVALVNVWATWCVGCRQEHGFLMELAESGAIPIYGLNWRDDRTEALRFLDTLGDPYVDSAYDGDGRVGIDWGVYGAPETFLIGKDGTVLYKHLGPLNWPLWQEFFVPHLESEGVTQ
ncbi:MAG: DsbE family thiol:disulfide interchange protein [Woeseiaceae bacterium]|nr:DsbE family thiol:disulfide interchange protein [Woeseiaceae bacterium]NIP20427.1 DsbE family thiol:disulfide interchange protein [Woeseiaceae bacterium]NIS89316.1 DsbE family thiol:disulfide interchange protein [Woeseiaceae bacterium]